MKYLKINLFVFAISNKYFHYSILKIGTKPYDWAWDLLAIGREVDHGRPMLNDYFYIVIFGHRFEWLIK